MTENAWEEIDVRLERIASQLLRVQRTVSSGRYSVEVLLQIAAVQAALAEVGRAILEEHFETPAARAPKSVRPQRNARVAR